MQATSLGLALVLAASAAIAAHCPHGQFWRPHLGKCVSLSSPAALAYEMPVHRTRIKITLPSEPEPLEPLQLPMDITIPGPDPDIIDIPLTDPDPATMAIKLQLAK